MLNYLVTGYKRVQAAFAKTGALLGSKIRQLFRGPVNDELFEELERLFYEADLGVATTQSLIARLKKKYQEDPSLSADQLLVEIKQEIIQELSKVSPTLAAPKEGEGPQVILIVGVNGNGKTTTVAKLAKRFKENGSKVLVVGADTFRAAAVEQLEMWCARIGVDLVKGKPNSDPSAVVFDAMQAAKARGCDVVLIDTAGRLQTKIPLMQELEKIKRTCSKFSLQSPHETLLVLDAHNGQNCIDQATVFSRYTPITGIILTKLDGNARGGTVIAIQKQLAIPVKFIGVGEGADDLQPFDSEAFVTALLN